jgi:hypothetical protein
MDSVPNPTKVEPRYATRMDEELTHAYEKIKSVDEEIARASEKLSRLERDDARLRPPRGRPALRGLIGLVLAAGICTAALIAQSSYGDTARMMIAGWAPVRAAASPQTQAEPAPAVQPAPAVAQLAKAEQALPQATAPAAQAVPDTVAPAATTLPPEVTELIQKMASDLASVQQGIEQLKESQAQLKANQEQMSLDNVRVADELKASQEQMARLVARTPETAGKAPDHPNAGQKTTAAPVPAPRPPAAAAARKPAPATPQPHAAVRRPAPVQLQSAEQ